MFVKLQTRGLTQEQISDIEIFVGDLDFNKPLHENYDLVTKYMQEHNLPSVCFPSVCKAVKDKDSLEHIAYTISNLDDALSKTRLPQSVKLYRAIKTNGQKNPNDYIGKAMSNEGYTSTSPIYKSSFAKYNDFDTVIEIFAPKGTKGLSITRLSDYDTAEQEVLLNANDIYVFDAKSNVIDQLGNSKTVLKGLLLSKERECYKGIDKEVNKDKNKEIELSSETDEKVLPAKQNFLSRIFNRIKSSFSKKELENSIPTNNIKQPVQEKKIWELEPEERLRLQIENAKLAEKYRKEMEAKKDSPSQELAKNNKPEKDNGDMEL